jgi:hypothetical protein
MGMQALSLASKMWQEACFVVLQVRRGSTPRSDSNSQGSIEVKCKGLRDSQAMIQRHRHTERAEGKVVRIENSYVVLGEPPNVLYVPYGNMAYIRFIKTE